MVVKKKVIAFLGWSYNGFIVRRVSGVPRYLPTKDELFKAIQFLPEDQFAAQMMEYYRRYGARKEVRGPIQYESNFLTVCIICFNHWTCKQIMTRNDCEQQGLAYYDGWLKKDGKDEVARTISGQPLLESLNSEPESAWRGSDSSVDVELFDSIWDNFDSKDGFVKRSDERACEPGM